MHRLCTALDRLDCDFCSLCTKDRRDWDYGSMALVALIVDDVVAALRIWGTAGGGVSVSFGGLRGR